MRFKIAPVKPYWRRHFTLWLVRLENRAEIAWLELVWAHFDVTSDNWAGRSGEWRYRDDVTAETADDPHRQRPTPPSSGSGVKPYVR